MILRMESAAVAFKEAQLTSSSNQREWPCRTPLPSETVTVLYSVRVINIIESPQNGAVRLPPAMMLSGLTSNLFAFVMLRLQFMSAGLDRTIVPTSIHCDHLIQASTGADSDLQVELSNRLPS